MVACNATATPTSTLPSPSYSPPTLTQNVIRLANGEWAPYTGTKLPHNGCDSWVVSEAFALEGITVEYGFFPWARSYNLSATGAWDGTLAWDDTPEHRTQHYLSAEPISVQEWIFFYRTDRPLDWKTLDDLAGKTLGVTAGYVYSNAFKALQQQGSVTFIESSSDEANFRILLAGRIDAFPMERQVGRTILKSTLTLEEQAQISASPKSFADFRSYLLLSKLVPRNEQWIARFDQGFKHLQESGRYAEIMQHCIP